MNRLFPLASSMSAVLPLTLTPALADRLRAEAWRDRPGQGSATHLHRAAIMAMSAARHV
jgi:hypothetical protein